MPTPRQQYVAKLNEISRRYAALEDDTLRRSAALLRDVQKQIAGELGTVTDFRAYRLKQLSANIDQIVAGYEARMTGEVRAALSGAWQSGGALVVEPLTAAGLGVQLFRPSYAQVNAILDFSADLVQNIGADMRNGINREIRLAVLGEKAPLEAMRGITQVLGVESEYGRFKGRAPIVRGVSARAETDLRTELMRVFNVAAYSQQQAVAQQVPGVKKSWMATADSRTRASHLRAHLEYKDHPIPVDEPFVLHDERDGRVELMYPLDPSGPPGQIINCRCRSVTVYPLLGPIATPLDARIKAEVEKRAA